MKTRRDSRRFRTARVRGEPYHVAGRTLVPVARVVTYGQARATVGTYRLAGRGRGWAHIRPLAIVEKTTGGERRIPIRDATAQSVACMAIAAVVITLLLSVVRWRLRCSGPRDRG